MLQHVAKAVVQHMNVAFARIWSLDQAGRVLELHRRDSGGNEGGGRGAAFTVSLPLAPAQAAASSPGLQNRSA